MFELKLLDNQIKNFSYEFHSGYDFRISFFNDNYYVNKIHKCGSPEAIAAGSYDYCVDLISKIKGQSTLF